MSGHILIVEDNALAAGALRLLLEESGYRVSAASTVKDAMEAARRERPDAMLLDLTLPDGSGLLAIEQLAATGEAPRVTVAVTGHDTEEIREQCLRAGCREVIVKPIKVRELPGLIERLLAVP